MKSKNKYPTTHIQYSRTQKIINIWRPSEYCGDYSNLNRLAGKKGSLSTAALAALNLPLRSFAGCRMGQDFSHTNPVPPWASMIATSIPVLQLYPHTQIFVNLPFLHQFWSLIEFKTKFTIIIYFNYNMIYYICSLSIYLIFITLIF
jgi:hypothetical protein